MNTEVPKKRRGRPPGSTGKTGPRPGSRPYRLANLPVGEHFLLEVPAGVPVTNYMQQIAADIGRVGLNGKVTQQLLIGIQPTTRQVYDIIRIVREIQ